MIDFSELKVDEKIIEKNNIKKHYKPEELKRTAKIQLYLTQDQKEIIERKAYENYMSLSNYILKKVME